MAEGAEGQVPPSPKFWAVGKLSKNVIIVGKFSSKVQNLGLKPPFLGNLAAKIEVLNTHNFLCRKFAVSVGKLQLPGPPTFSTHDTAARELLLATLAQ